MDKSWIELADRLSVAYTDGVEKFLEFAYAKKQFDSPIYCPCKKCVNRYQFTREIVKEHIVVNGFLRKYKNWTYHGESYVSLRENQDREEDNILMDLDMRDDMVEMVEEVMGMPGMDSNNGPDEETKSFFKLMEDAKTDLYPGCKKFTTLSFVVRLLHIKVLCGWTDKSVTMLLELLNEAFPENVKLSTSYYDASKITSNMGFSYEIMDACPNHCMLFREESKYLDTCEICGESRYKQGDQPIDGKKIPAQQVRYFPLKPRLKRLYMSSKTVSLMKWHVEERPNDGVLRHPADSPAWKAFDENNLIFANEGRNIRLGLASDGFNPFRTMSIAYSTWPVVLIPYNLPPWLCMKQPFFILSVLIDGPKGPGNKIDVYLQPLIDELKELWYDGVNTFDASTNQMFQLHAALLWTINDFPAYANLSSWSTKGALACPNCNKETRSFRLKNGRKYCYMGHRRFLIPSHNFRRDRVSFDGTREQKGKPKSLSGSELLQQLNDIQMITEYKKDDLIMRRDREEGEGEL